MATPKRNDTEYNLLWKIAENTATGSTGATEVTGTVGVTGNVGGKTKVIDVVVPDTTDAYVENDVVGGKLTFANAVSVAGTAVIHSLHVTDLDTGGFDAQLVLFSADPTASTLTDNGQLVIAAADLPNVIAVISLVASEFVGFAEQEAFCTRSNLGIAIQLAGTSLYAVLVATAARDSDVANSIRLKLGLLQD
jgi:hypothetical protein